MGSQKFGATGAPSLEVGAWLYPVEMHPSPTCITVQNLVALGQMIGAYLIRQWNLATRVRLSVHQHACQKVLAKTDKKIFVSVWSSCRSWLLFVVPCGLTVRGPKNVCDDDGRSALGTSKNRPRLFVTRQSVQGLRSPDTRKLLWGTQDAEKEMPKAESPSRAWKLGQKNAADGQRQSESPRLFQQRANWKTFAVLSHAIVLHIFNTKNKTIMNMLRAFYVLFYVHITIFL